MGSCWGVGGAPPRGTHLLAQRRGFRSGSVRYGGGDSTLIDYDFMLQQLLCLRIAINSFIGKEPYMAPIFVIRYAMRRSTKTVKNNSILPY